MKYKIKTTNQQSLIKLFCHGLFLLQPILTKLIKKKQILKSEIKHQINYSLFSQIISNPYTMFDNHCYSFVESEVKSKLLPSTFGPPQLILLLSFKLLAASFSFTTTILFQLEKNSIKRLSFFVCPKSH